MNSITHHQVIEFLEGLSIIELNALVRQLENRWDVKAGATVATVVEPQGVKKPEPSPTVDIVLESFGGQKIPVLRELRKMTGLSLGAVRDLIDNLPRAVLENVIRDEAQAAAEQLEALGATVALTDRDA